LIVDQDAWDSVIRDALEALCPGGEYERGADGTIKAKEEFCDRTVKEKYWECINPEKAGTPQEQVVERERDVDLPGSWRSVADHAKGCELVGTLVCNECLVTIKGGSGKYEADKGKAFGEAGHGGTVWVNASEQWHLWNSTDGEWKRDAQKTTVSKARITAHELGHAFRGCAGTHLTGTPANEVWEGTESEMLEYDGMPIEGYRKNGELKDAKAIRTQHDFIYTNREEFETMRDWENPIAKELGERPRFGHQ